MRMKKWMALLLAVVMVGALAACGSEEKSFTRGKWQGSHYTNEFMSLAFDLPEGWESASEAELAELMNISSTQTSGGKPSEEYLNAQNLYDVVAADDAVGSAIVIMAENLTFTPEATQQDAAQYAAAAIEALRIADPGIEAGEGATVTFAGQEYYTVDVSRYDGMMAQRYLFAKQGSYMTVVILSCLPELASLDSLIALFSAAE